MNSRSREPCHQNVPKCVDLNSGSGASNTSRRTYGSVLENDAFSEYSRYSDREPYNRRFGSFHGSSYSEYPSVGKRSDSHSEGNSSAVDLDREHWRYASLEQPSSSSRKTVQTPSQGGNGDLYFRFTPTETQTVKSTPERNHDSKYLTSSSFEARGSRWGLRSGSSHSEDLDGNGMNENLDTELLRKREKLQEIEEKIQKLKASIGLDTEDILVSTGATSRPNSSLRVRVMELLQQRHSPTFFSKAEKNKRKFKSSNPRDNIHHPLKLRVKALLEQKEKDPSVLLANRNKAAPVSPPPPSHGAGSPTKSITGKGFERFLNILNKGVDLNLLSRIVTDDTLELPDIPRITSVPQPIVGDASQADFCSERRELKKEAETEPRRQERSLKDDSRERTSKGQRCQSSGSRSKSPKPVKRREEEERRKADKQQEQLQNVLRALGVSLEVEEVSRLSDRTQQRLYGTEGTSHTRRVHREYSRRSSSSSSSSSPQSVSRSHSPGQGGSRDLEERRSGSWGRSSGWCSRGRSGDRTSGREESRASKEVETPQDPDSDHRPAYQPPNEHTQAQPWIHPAVAPFHYYTTSQYSQYYSSAIHPGYWPSSQEFPAGSLSQSSASMAQPSVYSPAGYSSFPQQSNSNLAESEGQSSSTSLKRFLTSVTVQQEDNQPLKRFLTSVTMQQEDTGNTAKTSEKKQSKWARKKARNRRNRLERMKYPQPPPEPCRSPIVTRLQSGAIIRTVLLDPEENKSSRGTSLAPPSLQVGEEVIQKSSPEKEEEKRPQSVEEIKANLRKKLQAFNQKVKNNRNLLPSIPIPPPANSLMD